MAKGPPETCTAEELVQRLANRPAPEKIVDLPESMSVLGESLAKVKIVIQPDNAHSAASMAALAHVRERLGKLYKREIKTDDLEPQIVKDLVGDRCAKEMLARSLYAPGDAGTIGDSEKKINRPLFMGADHIESLMHSDEIAILYDLFLTVSDELGPRAHVLTQDPEVLRQWIDRLKEGAWSLGPLVWLALADVRELCLSALRLLATYEALGLPLLTEKFQESLRGLVSTQPISDSVNTSSGEPAENSAPSTDEGLGIEPGESITVEKAYELAAKLRRP